MAAAQSTNASRPTFADFRASFKLNEPARPLRDLLQAHRLDQTRRDMLQRRLETISSFIIMMELMQERDVAAANHRDHPYDAFDGRHKIHKAFESKMINDEQQRALLEMNQHYIAAKHRTNFLQFPREGILQQVEGHPNVIAKSEANVNSASCEKIAEIENGTPCTILEEDATHDGYRISVKVSGGPICLVSAWVRRGNVKIPLSSNDLHAIRPDSQESAPGDSGATPNEEVKA